MEDLKLLKRLTVGQALPEIPLSVGSKLELLLIFAKFPYTSPYNIHSHINYFVRVCIIMYMTGGAEGFAQLLILLCTSLGFLSRYTGHLL